MNSRTEWTQFQIATGAAVPAAPVFYAQWRDSRMSVLRFLSRGGFVAASVLATGLLTGCGSGDDAQTGPNSPQLFLRAAVENSDRSLVTLPIFQGTSQGQTVWYVITDSSNQ